jgi:two-component system response regulator FlrC
MSLNDSILVVEDDAALRDALIDTLHAADLSAVCAADAPAALQMLQNEDIALVISDVQMPGPNGYQLLSSIKKLRPDLPVVLMTAYGTVAQAVAAMREGATDYIVKPFDAQALIEMARRQLALRVIPKEMVAVAKRSTRASSAIIRRAATPPTSPSIVPPSRRTCSRPLSLATKRALSPALRPRTPANSSKPKAARCCWMRSPR